MRVVNPFTGRSYFRKLRKRIDEPGHARELTFSCYKRFQFLNSDRTRQWFIDALIEAKQEFAVDLWAYVIMPEHVSPMRWLWKLCRKIVLNCSLQRYNLGSLIAIFQLGQKEL